MQKICSTCKLEKLIQEFNKDKYKPDGLTSSCKICISDRWKRYKESHKEQIKESTENFNARRRQERKDNPEEIRQKAREHYAKTREKRSEYDRLYRERHAEAISERRKIQRMSQVELNSLRNKDWRVKNKEKIQAKVKENSGYHAAIAAKRRATKLNATPTWLTEEQLLEIKLLYLFVAERRKLTGLDLEVDHIIPLQGENVCGLHVPWNLQVLTASENASKGNRFNPED